MVTPETIKLQGGSLALDFANTVDWTDDEAPIPATDVLLEPDSLARWGRRAGAAGTPTAASGAGPTDTFTHPPHPGPDTPTHPPRPGPETSTAPSQPRATDAPGAAGELALARGLRAALHAIFSALATAREPDPGALACLCSAYAAAVEAGTLVHRGGGLALDWPADDPRRVRFAVAADAVALLADPARVARLHRCPGRGCGWVFLDTSGRRRWCSMATCGSREKMRRMYARKRAATRREAPAGGSTA